MRALWIVAGLLACHTAFGQSFTNTSQAQGVEHFNASPFFGAGVSIHDIDGNGWDDLTWVFENDSVHIYLNEAGNFTKAPSPFFCDYDAKHPTWADYDNDGDLDLLITAYLGNTTLLRNDGSWNFTNVSATCGIPQLDGTKNFGACWADYDKDGWLDVYISNYYISDIEDQTNWLMHNNGDGTFTEVSEQAGVSNGVQLTFQSVWLDYDKDGWPDLFVANDKTSMENALYRNLGNGTFQDVSASANMDQALFAMCAAAGDGNSDGLLDVYCTNEPLGNIYMENNGDGTFTDVAGTNGTDLYSFTWAALFMDADNDTDEDLLVCNTDGLFGNQNFYLENDGSGNFTSAAATSFSDVSMLSYGAAKGDWNGDGYWDLAISNAGNSQVAILENDGGTNHFLKVNLVGAASHPSATGSWITAYYGEDVHSIYTMNGEGYLGQDSGTEIFGLGESTFVDSVNVQWPSGFSETHYGIEADQTVTFTEGSTLSFTLQYDPSGTKICPGDTYLLPVDDVDGEWAWNNGQVNQSLETTEPGDYFMTITQADGLIYNSDTVTVQLHALNSFEATSIAPLCSDQMGSLELLITGPGGPGSPQVNMASIEWNGGAFSGEVVQNVPAGTYEVIATDLTGCIWTGSTSFTAPDPLLLESSSTDVTCFGAADGSVTANAVGGSGDLTIEYSPGTENLDAGEVVVLVTDTNNCSVSDTLMIAEPPLLEVIGTATGTSTNTGMLSVSASGGIPPYTYFWENGGTGTELNALPPGLYGCWVFDANFCAQFIELEIEQFVGIDGPKAAPFRTFPNPTHDAVFFDATVSYDFVLFDPLGEAVKSGVLLPGRSLDLSDLPAGTFLLRAWNKTGTHDVRLIKW